MAIGEPHSQLHIEIGDRMVSLCELGAGESGTIARLSGGSGFVGRLAALGFTPGATVDVERNSGHGPIIVNILDTQIALGRGEALKVRVRPKLP